MTINGWTLALQAINFLVLVWLLQRFLYKPVLAVIAKRKQLVEQAFAEAETAKGAAAAEQQKYQQGQAELAQSRQDLLRKTHAELEAERGRVLDQARAEATAMLDAARVQIETERTAALDGVRAQIADMAVEMAATVLRRVAAPSAEPALLNDGFLAQVTSGLDELPAQERAALRRDLESAGAGLAVVTGSTLSSDEQQRWQRQLQKRLGSTAVLEFMVDPALVGGAELRFPHAVLSFGWSELLRQGKEALLADEAAR